LPCGSRVCLEREALPCSLANRFFSESRVPDRRQTREIRLNFSSKI
jgi:hypothetical protein